VAWFDCAVHRPISGGTFGPLTAQRGLVLHHAVAMNSLYSTFNNGKVSTQFWVSLSGQIEQYLDSTMSAWATGSDVGNMQFCSVETEGCVAAPHAQPMSDAMVSALATLYREGHERHGWPYQLANSTAANGFGYHRLWSATACPCDVRVNRRADILTLAQGTPQEAEMAVSPVVNFKAGQLDLFQVSLGTLWHKWEIGGTWRNESIPMPAGVGSLTGTPEVSEAGGTMYVSVEDASGKAVVASQGAGAGTWSVTALS
jgi:hypothetical protein